MVEEDSQIVVGDLTVARTSLSSIQKVIEGTKETLGCFNSWRISHIHRSGNTAAHIKARHAKSIPDCIIWVEDTPPPIINQILKDVISMDFSPV